MLSPVLFNLIREYSEHETGSAADLEVSLYRNEYMNVDLRFSI